MRVRHRCTAALLVTWWLVAPAAGRGQSVESGEPLGPLEPSGIVEEDLGEDVEALLAEAEEVFRSADQPESITLYERIILLLERYRREGTLDEQGGEWLEQALFRRAEARSNLLDEDGAAADLRAIVLTDPAWEVPAGYTVSRLLSDLLAKVRDAETGVLDPLIDPPQAELFLDGEPLPPLSGPRRVLAGDRLLRVRRPGFTEVELELTIPPGETVPVELALERVSAVVRMRVSPPGVEVLLGDEVLAAARQAGEGAAPGGFAEIVVEGLEVGRHLLTLRRPGYRPQEVRVEVPELADYVMEPVALEPMRGTVRLSEVPAGARVLLDGKPRGAPGERRTGVELELPPGDHAVRVEAGAAGLFESRFRLEDRERLELEVVLRPGLVLLGVLGGDRVAAGELEARLADRLAALEQWALSLRVERGFELLREAGVDRHLLRALADGSAAGPPDWEGLQADLDAGLGGSAYLAAVLSDDLYASEADLWLWSAAPGPARPVRRRVSLSGGGGLEEMAAALDRPLRLSAPWVGARFVDSAAAEAPLVLSVEPGGPAAEAGLRAGDTLRAVDGEPVATAGEVTAKIAALAAGRKLTLDLGEERQYRRITLVPAVGPAVVSLSDPAALDPALAARLASLEAAGREESPPWLVRLNRGVVLMRSGEWRRAAEALRGIEAPTAGGVGQATVDYLLGLALLEVDRATYRATAEQLIGRAAAGRGRLEHNDGPLLAPRARARLETLLGGE